MSVLVSNRRAGGNSIQTFWFKFVTLCSKRFFYNFWRWRLASFAVLRVIEICVLGLPISGRPFSLVPSVDFPVDSRQTELPILFGLFNGYDSGSLH